MNSDQIALFTFTYVSINQAPDALLARATYDAQQLFIEPDKFDFFAVYDTCPDEDDVPEPGTVKVLVTAQYHEKTRFLDRFKRQKASIYA